jgi:PAS domain S-box-containing protein
MSEPLHASVSAPTAPPDLFRLLVESVKDYAIFVLDPAGNVASWNEGAERIKGYRAEEIVGQPFSRFYTTEDVAAGKPRRELDIALAEGRYEEEGVRVRKDGSHFWAGVTITALYDPSHNHVGFAKVTRDVTERKAAEFALGRRSEEALRASQEIFRSAFEHTNVAMVLTDVAHRFVRVNAAFARLFGYAEEELLGMSMADVTHADDLGGSLAGREALLAGTAPSFEIEKRYRHKGGHIFWGLANVSLVRDARGEPLLYVGQVQDITKRKRAEEANTKYIERLRILRHIDRALIAGEGPAAIAAAALAPLRELLGVPRAIVNLFDLANGEVEWLAAAGRRRVHVGPGVRYSIRLMGDVEALRRGELQWIDVHALPPSPEVDALLASGVHAYAVVPMIAEGELIGALSFGGASLPLSTEQVSIAQEAASQFAIALAQARLHERVKRQAQELEVRVAERKQAEEALGQAQQRVEHVVASSPAVLYTLAVEGQAPRLSWISENVREITGYPVEDALRPNWWEDGLHPDERDRVAAEIRDLLAHGSGAHEYLFRHRDGQYHWVRAEMRLLRDAAGNPVEVVGSWSDITERKQLEEQFRQAQMMEAVGRLAGGVAHDFNNLLTVINGYGQLVVAALPPGDPNRELVREMATAGERAAVLTRQLLAFSRNQLVAPRVLDLKALLADLDSLVRRVIGEDLRLVTASDPDLWPVKADPGQVEQVVLNLVVNARDAMPTGGSLTVETRNVDLDESYARLHAEARPGPHVLLAVTDTGCGMDAATQARIFEPFFTTKGERGTCLGLATVHGIVRQAGGHVAVYSEPGRGSTLKVYLPRTAEGVPSATPVPGLRVMPRGTEAVLLVEDEEAVRALARHVLKECGYTVLEAADGQQALRIAEQHRGRIDLLVTDVVMPDLGGRLLAERLTASRPGLKVLYLSGYTDDAVVWHGILEAQVHFLQKPYAPAALAQKVRQVLDAG